MTATAIDSLRGILNGFRDLNSKGIYTMNATETDLLRQILLEVQALSLGGGVADGSITTAKLADGAVTTVKILDANVTTAKILDANVTPAKLSQPFTSASAVAASGTQIDFTNIPSWAKQIDIPISGLSTNGTSSYLIQLGDSGGIENTGYLSATMVGAASVSTANPTIGFSLLVTATASAILHGTVSLRLVDSATNTWSCQWIGGGSDSAYMTFAAGSKSLSGSLDRVRFTTTSGDTIDAGSLRINYYG